VHPVFTTSPQVITSLEPLPHPEYNRPPSSTVAGAEEQQQQQRDPQLEQQEPQQQQQQQVCGHIVLVASTKVSQAAGCPSTFCIRIPKRPGYFTGTGDGGRGATGGQGIVSCQCEEQRVRGEAAQPISSIIGQLLHLRAIQTVRFDAIAFGGCKRLRGAAGDRLAGWLAHSTWEAGTPHYNIACPLYCLAKAVAAAVSTTLHAVCIHYLFCVCR
jgi:hypothetical protein